MKSSKRRIYTIKTDELTSKRMKKVKTSNTLIEKKVRSTLHYLGYRFRLNYNLPGKPDIVVPRYKTVIFVHGCFWHGHEYCKKGTLKPKRNALFWKDKIQYNKKKDCKNRKILENIGWKVLIIWECEIKDLSHLEKIINNFLIRNEKKIL